MGRAGPGAQGLRWRNPGRKLRGLAQGSAASWGPWVHSCSRMVHTQGALIPEMWGEDQSGHPAQLLDLGRPDDRSGQTVTYRADRGRGSGLRTTCGFSFTGSPVGGTQSLVTPRPRCGAGQSVGLGCLLLSGLC